MIGGHLGAAGCFNNHCQSWLNIGCWNMRSLVEAEGSVATASVRGGVQVDRKINLLVDELRHFDMCITGVSESKWFGQGVYEVDGFVMVHSGRPLPIGNDSVLRNEAVGIVMNPVVAAAWRDSGECWKAISSRIVYAPMKLQCSKHHRRRGKQEVYLSVVSVYAPTYHSLQDQKDLFYDDLCCLINSICEDELLIVLGDFNA